MDRRLPWEKDTLGTCNNGFLVDVCVKTSSIQQANRGRFLEQSINDSQRIRQLKCIDVYSDDIFTNDKYILVTNFDELEHLINRYSNISGKNIKKISNIIVDYMGATTSQELYILSSSYFTNTSTNPNYHSKIINDTFISFSSQQLNAGSELFCDYTRYKFPLFFLEWCECNKLVDPTTFAHTLTPPS